MAVVDLKKLLTEAENLSDGETICPHLTDISVVHAPLEKNPGLSVFVVTCAGKLCGRFPACSKAS